MTLRKTLKALRGKLEEMRDDAQDDLTEIMVNIVDASATDEHQTPLIVGRMVIPINGAGETVTEWFAEDDPRRVPINPDR